MGGHTTQVGAEQACGWGLLRRWLPSRPRAGQGVPPSPRPKPRVSSAFPQSPRSSSGSGGRRVAPCRCRRGREPSPGPCPPPALGGSGAHPSERGTGWGSSGGCGCGLCAQRGVGGVTLRGQSLESFTSTSGHWGWTAALRPSHPGLWHTGLLGPPPAGCGGTRLLLARLTPRAAGWAGLSTHSGHQGESPRGRGRGGGGSVGGQRGCPGGQGSCPFPAQRRCSQGDSGLWGQARRPVLEGIVLLPCGGRPCTPPPSPARSCRKSGPGRVYLCRVVAGRHGSEPVRGVYPRVTVSLRGSGGIKRVPLHFPRAAPAQPSRRGVPGGASVVRSPGRFPGRRKGPHLGAGPRAWPLPSGSCRHVGQGLGAHPASRGAPGQSSVGGLCRGQAGVPGLGPLLGAPPLSVTQGLSVCQPRCGGLEGGDPAQQGEECPPGSLRPLPTRGRASLVPLSV